MEVWMYYVELWCKLRFAGLIAVIALFVLCMVSLLLMLAIKFIVWKIAEKKRNDNVSKKNPS